MSLSFYPWTSGANMKWNFLKYKHMNHYITIARDRDPGMIYPDPISGDPRVRYSPSAFDRSHILTGQLATARMLFVAGAEEIHVMTAGIPPFKRRGYSRSGLVSSNEAYEAGSGDNFKEKGNQEEQEFENWLSSVRNKGLATPYSAFGNAHQMGTCRMGTSESTSVVDPNGRVWGVKNLWVCDASIFPSASGVNPMVTVMAIADWIAESVCEDTKVETLKKSAML